MRNITPSPLSHGRFLTAVLTATGLLFACSSLPAAALTWDPTLTPTTPAGGAGTWDLGTANWSNTGTDVIWTDTTGTGDVATFGGTGGAVALNTSLGALGLVFAAPGYTISGTGTLTLGASGIDAGSLTSGTTSLGNPMTLEASQSWNTGSGSTLSSTGTINTGGFELTLASAGINKLTGVIGGAGSLKQTGGGITAVNATNTYNGGTTVNSGLLAVGTVTGSSLTVPTAGSAIINTSALGTGLVTVNTGGTLGLGFSTATVGYNSGVYTYANNITLNGGGINVLDGQTALSGTVTIGASGGFIKSTYGTDRNKGVWIDGVLAGSGTLDTGFTYYNRSNNVTYAGSSVFVTGGGNTFSGTVNVNPTLNGTNGVFNQGGSYLWLASSNALANATLNITGGNYGSKVQYGSSPLLFVAGITSYTIGGLSGVDGVVLTNRNYYDRDGTTLISTGGQAVTLSVGNNNADTTYSGIISGSGGITKIGSGKLTLTGSSTFAGGVIVNGGTLYANSANAANNRTFSYVSTITVNNGATLRTSSNALFGWDGTQEHAVTINAGGTLTADSNADVGVGTVTLAGGTLANLGASTAYGSWRFDDATDKLVVTDDSTVSASNVKFGNAGAYVDVAAGKTLNFTGTVTNATSGGTSYLTKSVGTGTLTLSGINTYTGATTVSAGILKLSGTGSINNSALTLNGATANFRNNSSVNYTGTLTFTQGTISGTNWNGSLSGLTIGANQTISPGNSPGTATTGSQTWAGGGTYEFEVNNFTGTAGSDPGWDLVSLTGNLDITATSGSTFTIKLTSLTLADTAGSATNFSDSGNYSLKLASVAGSLTGFASDKFTVDTTGFSNAFTGTWSVANVGQDLYLNYAAVAIPEPSTFAALFGAVALLGAGLCRRRKA